MEQHGDFPCQLAIGCQCFATFHRSTFPDEFCNLLEFFLIDIVYVKLLIDLVKEAHHIGVVRIPATSSEARSCSISCLATRKLQLSCSIHGHLKQAEYGVALLDGSNLLLVLGTLSIG